MPTVLLILAGLLAPPGEAPREALVLRFDEALTRAAARPDLAGAAAGLDAHRALARALSGQTQPISLMVLPGARIRPVGTEGPELQVQLGYGLSLSGLGDARRAALTAEQRALGAALRDARMGARLAAAQAWIAAWAAQERHAASQAAHRAAEGLAARVGQAVEAGLATRDDLAEAQAEVAQAQLAVVDALGLVEDAGHALGRAVGEPSGAPLAAAGPLPRPALPAGLPAGALAARAADLPAPAQRRLAALAAEARAVEIRAAAGPQLQLGAQLEIEDRTAVLLGVGLTWPAFDQGERARAGARAEAAAARGSAAQAAIDAAHALGQALHEVEHARERSATFEGALLPALEALVAAREARLVAGQATVFDALRAQARLAQAHQTHAELRAALAWAEIGAWILLAAAGEAGGDPE